VWLSANKFERMPSLATPLAITDMPPRRDLQIVVLGYIVRAPLGGLAWHHLQYVAGLVRLGYDVLFIEDSDDYPSCVHLDRDVDDDPSEGLAFTENAFERLGIAGRFAYYDAPRREWLGPAAHRAHDFCAAAQVVLNISGINPVRPWWRDAPIRILIDTDPAFLQVRHLQCEAARALAGAHNAFFTFGEKITVEDCSIPDDGFPWRPTRQPVVLDSWPVTQPSQDHPFTTVLQWDSYESLNHHGRRYGMKSESFRQFCDIPRRCNVPLLLGMGGNSDSAHKNLDEHGWRVRNAIEFSRDPWQYQKFIQQSAGEFSVAKQGYVVSNSGWFSERSANYLASGRPVILQDTGFSHILPTGEGLLAFTTPNEAVECLERVRHDLERHSRAARAIAAEHFDSDKILSDLLEQAEALGPMACGTTRSN
jgi:hypothetical protein